MENKFNSIKIKFKDLEFEICGSQNFIESQISKLEEIIGVLSGLNINNDKSSAIGKNFNSSDNIPTLADKPTLDDILKSDFSVWMKVVSSNNNNLTMFLIAAYYIQINNTDNYFTTNEVFSLLYDNGFFIENIKYCEELCIKNKNIKKIGTTKEIIKYQINDEALDLICEILELSLYIS